MNDRGPIFTTVSVQEILDEIDHAIGDHISWLADWHRVLVCREAPSPKDLAYDPHHLCRFGSWYVKNQHMGLVNQPALRNLAKLHRDMHDRAKELMESARGGEPPPRSGYDAFMDLAKNFIARSRRLENAFAQASSDLDPLTGLNNRQAMNRDLDREHERLGRSGRPSCIAIGDIDFFKKVNDTYGHAAGDRVLTSAADCFLTHLRPYDSLYRYGGEEFLFCLPDTGMAMALTVLDRLRVELAARVILPESGEELKVTCSFGVAEMSSGAAVKHTIERADQALYCAKDQGRNRVCGWDGPDEVDAL
ncbi:MAG: hypothetical protein A3G18_11295 [Rhodospirillales bacterium RIFCSPLOWO2_12_FULL_58_28]|nr:MAG: hypothetical protein A3H92_10440 [Rhodospirillales bacterium RIFCSPLOWO2_02_FULL_58_16]OHC77775.1 MAG: hypothetical protein A3G18_11295 [Rhodospirillales bacterium RIFCSPLOWO2_12_FULL_58_28]